MQTMHAYSFKTLSISPIWHIYERIYITILFSKCACKSHVAWFLFKLSFEIKRIFYLISWEYTPDIVCMLKENKVYEGT